MSARLTPDFNINTGLDDSKVIIQYPKDPIEIGKVVKDGNLEPVWVDPTQFVPTPDQKLEQAQNMKGMAVEADLERARWEIAARVEEWMDRKIRSLYPGKQTDPQGAIAAWCAEADINFIEDTTDPAQVRFVLRKGDKPLSEFIASVQTVH